MGQASKQVFKQADTTDYIPAPCPSGGTGKNKKTQKSKTYYNNQEKVFMGQD
jgi:hypothetical protein